MKQFWETLSVNSSEKNPNWVINWDYHSKRTIVLGND